MAQLLNNNLKRLIFLLFCILIAVKFPIIAKWILSLPLYKENLKNSKISQTHSLNYRVDKSELSSEEVFNGVEVFLDQSDERLLNYIRHHHLFPPSREPYNLLYPMADPTVADGQEWKVVQRYLGNKTNGFFIECGANDGEFLSNTLVLERDYSWNGLLIESDPIPLEPLFKKNRKSWISNACLSTKPYPEIVTMKKLDYGSFGGGMAEYGWHLVPAWDQRNNNRTFDVKCLPFYSILSALNRFEIDFFALDVEMAELPILKTIPFDKVFIKVFAIEIHPPLHLEVIPFMIDKGYKCVKHIAVSHTLDYIFVHERILAMPGMLPESKCPEI